MNKENVISSKKTIFCQICENEVGMQLIAVTRLRFNYKNKCIISKENVVVEELKSLKRYFYFPYFLI